MAWDNQPEERAFSFDRSHIRIFRRIGREYCGLLVVCFVLILVENGYLARRRPFLTSDNVHIQIFHHKLESPAAVFNLLTNLILQPLQHISPLNPHLPNPPIPPTLRRLIVHKVRAIILRRKMPL